jgi:hypothetical protein
MSVFYIGKGKAGRPWARDHRNAWWGSIAAAHGLVVEVLAIWRTNEDACAHERFLIACFREMGARLCNVTDGGEGALGRRHTEEAKARISAANSGRRRSPEHVARIVAYMSGRPKSEEQRAKMSAARKGCKKPPEEIAAYLPALRAAMARPEVRAKISAAATKRVVSAETRAKMSASRRGRVQPPEERAIRSEALKRFHEKKRTSR